MAPLGLNPRYPDGTRQEVAKRLNLGAKNHLSTDINTHEGAHKWQI
ncbi:MAG: hypothetical protein ACI8PT_003462 [Gammaproteobacteria bacterium]|jgi:hypothetical protein